MVCATPVGLFMLIAGVIGCWLLFITDLFDIVVEVMFV